MRAAIARHRDNCARHDPDRLRVKHAVIGSCVNASDGERRVLKKQLDGFIERLDVRQRGDKRAAAVILACQFHVPADDPGRKAHGALDDLVFVLPVDHSVMPVTLFWVEHCRFQELNLFGRLGVDQALDRFGQLGIRPRLQDRLGLDLHLAVDVIGDAVGAFLERD